MSKDFSDILSLDSDSIFLEDNFRKLTFQQTKSFSKYLEKYLKDIPSGSLVLVDIRDPFYFIGILFACFNKKIKPALLNWHFSENQISNIVALNTYSAFISDQKISIDLPTVRLDSSEEFSFIEEAPFELSSSNELIFFSSGSVKVKACLTSLSQFIYSALGSNQNIPFNAGDTWGLCLPHFHVGGFSIFIRALITKGRVFATKELTDLDDKTTHISLVSTQYIRAIESAADLRHLRHILLGGSAIPQSYLKKGIERGLSIHKSYGMTEMATQISTTPILDKNSDLQSSGSVLPYRELKVLDGKIYVKGQCLFKGYLENNKPILNLTDDGWFCTNDLGYLNDRGLFVTGRSDRVFQCGGENISPETIEHELLMIEGVLRAHVVPQSDPKYGHRPIAYIETIPSINESQIKETLEKRLNGFYRPIAYYPWSESPKKTWK